MTKMISFKDLINELNEKKINLGKGDPYNRLRYYTKIGWLPNMKRLKTADGQIQGHFPYWVLDRLKRIDTLKKSGAKNEEISILITKKSPEKILDAIYSSDFKNKLGIIFITLIILFLVVMQILIFDSQRSFIEKTSMQNLKIIENGQGKIDKDQKTIFIQSKRISEMTKILITFENDIYPAKMYWVQKDILKNGFTLHLSDPATQEVRFYWWISE